MKIALAAAVQRPVVALRRTVGLPPTLSAQRGGLAWKLDLREGIDFSIWLLGAFERRMVAAYSELVRPGSIVFDIGANIGAHTLPLAKRVGRGGHVHAFEPTRWAAEKLRANLSLNPDILQQAIVHQTMLAERDDAALPDAIHASWPLQTHEGVHPTLRARRLPTSGASTTTLDAFVRHSRIERLDFMKLDVDGYECKVLRGGEETLKRFRPPIILELSPYILEESGDSLDALLDILERRRYELSDLVTGCRLPARHELARAIPRGGGINVLARVGE